MFRVDRSALRAGFAAGALSFVSGGAAWLTGLPALFPSLGPTAYVLAERPDAPESQPRRVFGGHAIGVVVGIACYALVAGSGTVAAPPPDSFAGLRLALAGVLSVGLTTAATLATDLRHAPACATTLIVSLGLLSTPREGLLVVAAVAVAVHRAGRTAITRSRQTLSRNGITN
ncbi:MAG: HPP family protein [Haloglomus sp.]